jgi:inosose dehydratase
MSSPIRTTRRNIIGAAAAVSALSVTPLQARDESKPSEDDASKIAGLRSRLAMASYSLRKFDLDSALAMTARLGLNAVSLKAFHLPLDADAETIASCVDKAKKAGIVVYGGGVIGMKTPEEVDHAFEYARAAGMSRIICSPDPQQLPRIDEKIREYDIVICIHNHGPGDRHWATPEIGYEKVERYDRRLGFCHDVGHTKRVGADPVAITRSCADRIHDLHFKDINEAKKSGHVVPCGRGVIDVPALLRVLLEIDYQGYLAFEYEQEPGDPLPAMAESIGYVRGVLDQMAE